MRDSAIASFDAAVCRFAPAKTGNRLDGTGCRSTYFWAPAPEAAGNTGTLCSLFDFFAYMEKKIMTVFVAQQLEKLVTQQKRCACAYPLSLSSTLGLLIFNLRVSPPL